MVTPLSFKQRQAQEKPSDKVRVVLIQGSPRAADNCPGQEPKSAKLVKQLSQDKDFKHVDLDVLDLAVRDKHVQPCKSCVSTAAPLCCWPCNCYSPNDKEYPDLMHDEDVYSRLQNAHGFMVVTPIHWYGPSSVVKAMFDRLVCCNGGNQSPDLIDGKDPEKARALEKSPLWEDIKRNHLAGKYAAFFIMGDNGANEGQPNGVPKLLHDERIFSAAKEAHFNDPKHAVMPIVWQMRYSGVWVKDDCIGGLHFGEGSPYADNIKNFRDSKQPYEKVKSVLKKLIGYIEADRVNIECSTCKPHKGHAYPMR